LNGIAIAGGAVEGREVAVGKDGRGEDAVEGCEERELFGLPESCGVVVRMLMGSLQDESSGFGVGEDGGCHVGLILLPDREWTPTRVGWRRREAPDWVSDARKRRRGGRRRFLLNRR
jgi:hypothetical protein